MLTLVHLHSHKGNTRGILFVLGVIHISESARWTSIWLFHESVSSMSSLSSPSAWSVVWRGVLFVGNFHVGSRDIACVSQQRFLVLLGCVHHTRSRVAFLKCDREAMLRVTGQNRLG
eukprot:c14154_g1_i1.p1 GENE.c14154_g1_i1~~c14154_g1_i1.p1  ORF type:complete len:117 (+),score=23.27 c14154_g1_i1:307-657(+)